jgi:hypothetical protein
MTEQEWRAFVMDGTRTAKVATAREDGNELRRVATRIGRRYMGNERAEEFGEQRRRG